MDTTESAKTRKIILIKPPSVPPRRQKRPFTVKDSGSATNYSNWLSARAIKFPSQILYLLVFYGSLLHANFIVASERTDAPCLGYLIRVVPVFFFIFFFHFSRSLHSLTVFFLVAVCCFSSTRLLFQHRTQSTRYARLLRPLSLSLSLSWPLWARSPFRNGYTFLCLRNLNTFYALLFCRKCCASCRWCTHTTIPCCILIRICWGHVRMANQITRQMNTQQRQDIERKLTGWKRQRALRLMLDCRAKGRKEKWALSRKTLAVWQDDSHRNRTAIKGNGTQRQHTQVKNKLCYLIWN